MTRREEGVDDLVAALLTASRVLVGVSAASLAQLGDTVTLTQFRALVVLDGSRGSNLNRLADQLGVTASTAMRMVDRLVTAGMVTRADNPANRRELVLGLTDAGAQVVRGVTEHRRAELARIVARMPVGGRAELVAALTEFSAAAGEPPVGGPAAPLGW